MFPNMIKFAYMPADRRYARNVNRFRACLQKMINDRKAGQDEEQNDLLSILIREEFF